MFRNAFPPFGFHYTNARRYVSGVAESLSIGQEERPCRYDGCVDDWTVRNKKVIVRIFHSAYTVPSWPPIACYDGVHQDKGSRSSAHILSSSLMMALVEVGRRDS